MTENVAFIGPCSCRVIAAKIQPLTVSHTVHLSGTDYAQYEWQSHQVVVCAADDRRFVAGGIDAPYLQHIGSRMETDGCFPIRGPFRGLKRVRTYSIFDTCNADVVLGGPFDLDDAVCKSGTVLWSAQQVD